MAAAQADAQLLQMFGTAAPKKDAGKLAKAPADAEADAAPPANAAYMPQNILPGELIESTLEGAPVSAKGNARRCFLLSARAGTAWSVFVSQKKRDDKRLTPLIVPGNDCDKGGFNLPSANGSEGNGFTGYSYNTTTNFISGGGFYTIVVFAKPEEKFGAFRMRVTQVTPASVAGAQKLASAADLRFGSDDGKTTASTAAPREPGKYKVGQLFRDCADTCPAMVVVPAGSFAMGSAASEDGRGSDEGPVHRVTFANAFAIGETEVTFEQWDSCVADRACPKPADEGWGRGKRPVINVSWTDARTYVAWLSRTTGQRYFLPSEAEWEYAARAGTKTPWNTGTAIVTDDANFLGAFKQTVPVGGFPANAWKIKDVHGNVREWVLDCKDVGYFGVPNDGGAAMMPGCAQRVTRGGAFGSPASDVRSAARRAHAPGGHGNGTGFRVARAL